MQPDYPDVMKLGPLTLYGHRGRILWHGSEVRLTAGEFKILRHLIYKRDRIVSRQELYNCLYDTLGAPDSNSLEVLVNRIRGKLSYNVISTMRGLGYIMEEALDQDRE
ncbi:MAG: winged helix family transcriptional regulator [Oxalobacteraceae bacterium]|jgi:two-component system OmpR family response regulator|nr:MAG: winged helix family transcriptional regulator [Oxalobacteraceae bacterium]